MTYHESKAFVKGADAASFIKGGRDDETYGLKNTVAQADPEVITNKKAPLEGRIPSFLSAEPGVKDLFIPAASA
jgi:hypothetical protein